MPKGAFFLELFCNENSWNVFLAGFLLPIVIPESLAPIPIILLRGVEWTEWASRDTSITSPTNKRCPTKTPVWRPCYQASVSVDNSN